MMKKNKSAYLSILFLVTIVCIFIGLHLHVFSEAAKGLQQKESYDFTGQSVEFISIKVDTAKVKVKYGDKFSVDYNLPKKSSSSVSLDNGKLNVRESSSKNKISFLPFGKNNEGEITIVLPYDTEVDKINIELSAANLDLNDLKSKSTFITTDVGNVKLDGHETEYLQIDSSVGNVKLYNCTCDSCLIEVDTGNVKGDACNIKTGTCTSHVGNIKLNGNLGDLKASSQLGNVKVNGD